eukprot:3010244-Amphidinium_carterae.1
MAEDFPCMVRASSCMSQLDQAPKYSYPPLVTNNLKLDVGKNLVVRCAAPYRSSQENFTTTNPSISGQARYTNLHC